MKNTRVAKVKNTLKNNKSAGRYIGSGLLKTAIQMLSSLIILRWVLPEELGLWQSFTVFVGYIAILNLGVPVGINRELPFLLGKGDENRGMDLLKTAGAYMRFLGIGIILLVSLIGVVLYSMAMMNLQGLTFLSLAILLTALNMQATLVGATFRSSSAFNKLANMHFILSILFIVLMPLIYFFGIWGYIAYIILIALLTYLLYSLKRPYKIKYNFNKQDFIYLVKVGFPIYFWNYINSQIQSFPRLVLVLLGTPYLVGLFAPAASIKQVMLNLPKYTNRYLFPQMAHKYGKTDDAAQVIRYAFKSAKYLFAVTFFGALVVSYALIYVFPLVFPKYVDGIVATQITVFTGVIYGVNLVFHNALNALRQFAVFKVIILLKLILILAGTYMAYLFFPSLLTAVAVGSLFSETLSTGLYIWFLKKV